MESTATDLPTPEVTVAMAADSSEAPVPASSGAPVSAIQLLPPSGGDVFATMVPPARSSFCFVKKKVAG